MLRQANYVTKNRGNRLNSQVSKLVVPSMKLSDGIAVMLDVKLDEAGCVVPFFGSASFASRANRRSVRVALQAQ